LATLSSRAIMARARGPGSSVTIRGAELRAAAAGVVSMLIGTTPKRSGASCPRPWLDRAMVSGAVVRDEGSLPDQARTAVHQSGPQLHEVRAGGVGLRHVRRVKDAAGRHD